MLVIRAVTGLYPDTVLLDGNRGRGYEATTENLFTLQRTVGWVYD